MKETAKQVRSTPQPGKAIIKEVDNDIGKRSISKMLFDVAVTVFFGIEFGGISREMFMDNFRVFIEKGLRETTGVNTSTVPNQDKSFWEELKQVLEEADNLWAFDTSRKMAFVDFAS
jgi:hypothetical protein